MFLQVCVTEGDREKARLAKHGFQPGPRGLWNSEVDTEKLRLPSATRNHGRQGHSPKSLRCPSPLGNAFSAPLVKTLKDMGLFTKGGQGRQSLDGDEGPLWQYWSGVPSVCGPPTALGFSDVTRHAGACCWPRHSPGLGPHLFLAKR